LKFRYEVLGCGILAESPWLSLPTGRAMISTQLEKPQNENDSKYPIATVPGYSIVFDLLASLNMHYSGQLARRHTIPMF